MISDFVLDLSNYKVIQKIDENQCKNIFLIEDQKNKNKYIAHVNKNECVSPNQQKYFLLEVQTNLQLQYPTLFHAIGYNFFNFESKPFPTIIFEYIPQGSLRKLLDQVEKGKTPSYWNDTNRYCIILGIAFGLRCLHSKNIIHKNLSPEYILIDSHCIPRISDYDISLIPNKQPKDMKTKDSFYLAPEIISEEKFDCKVDIFSFAKIMYEIITLKQSPINITEIPDPENQQFFTKCLSTDPSQRPSSDEIFRYISAPNFLRLFKNIDYAELKKFLGMFVNENDWFIRFGFLFNQKMSVNDIIDIETELSYLKKFADEGNPDAMFYYYLLSDDKREEEERIRYLKKSVEKEHVMSLFVYAQKLQKGEKFVEKNIEDALFYLKLAANKGDKDSMNEYARLRRESKNGDLDDKKEAARYFKMAADQGSKTGMEQYADMLRKGDGIPVNIEEADRYSQMAKLAQRDCIIC